MRKVVISVTAAVAVLGGATVGPAAAQTAPAPNTTVHITFVGGPVGVVKSTGAINAVGVALEQTTLNPVGTFTGTLTFVFPLGTVTAPSSGFVSSVNVDASCTGRFTSVGWFTVTAGTGLYTGISGSGTFTESGIFNAVPTGTGCSPDLQVRTYLATEATANVVVPSNPLGGLLAGLGLGVLG